MPFFDWVIREESQPGSVGHFQPAGTFLFKHKKHKYLKKKKAQLPTFGFGFSTKNLWHDCWPLSHIQRPLLLEFLRLSNLLQSLAGCQPQRRRERRLFLVRVCERGSWKKWSYPLGCNWQVSKWKQQGWMLVKLLWQQALNCKENVKIIRIKHYKNRTIEDWTRAYYGYTWSMWENVSDFKSTSHMSMTKISLPSHQYRWKKVSISKGKRQFGELLCCLIIVDPQLIQGP